MDIEEFLLYLQSYYGSGGMGKKRGGVTQPNKMRVPIFDSREGFSRETYKPPQPPQAPMGMGGGMAPPVMPGMGGGTDPQTQMMEQLGMLLAGGGQ